MKELEVFFLIDGEIKKLYYEEENLSNYDKKFLENLSSRKE